MLAYMVCFIGWTFFSLLFFPAMKNPLPGAWLAFLICMGYIWYMWSWVHCFLKEREGRHPGYTKPWWINQLFMWLLVPFIAVAAFHLVINFQSNVQ
jgi:hypothetical protein